MLAVFKNVSVQWHLLVAISLLLIAFESRAQDVAPPEASTMALFHDSDRPAEITNQWVLQTVEQDIEFVVLEMDKHEPAHAPLRLVIGYQFEDQDFRRLNPAGEVVMDKTFCGMDEPFIVERDQFFAEMGLATEAIAEGETFYEPGDYLLVPVQNFDDNQTACKTGPMDYEVFWIEGIRQQHHSED